MIGVFVTATLGDRISILSEICYNHVVGSRRYRPTALGVSVHLGNDDSTKVRALLERATLSLGGLAYN